RGLYEDGTCVQQANAQVVLLVDAHDAEPGQAQVGAGMAGDPQQDDTAHRTVDVDPRSARNDGLRLGVGGVDGALVFARLNRGGNTQAEADEEHVLRRHSDRRLLKVYPTANCPLLAAVAKGDARALPEGERIRGAELYRKG